MYDQIIYDKKINEKYLELATQLENDYKEYSRLGKKLDIDTCKETLDFRDFCDLCEQLNLPVLEEYYHYCPFGNVNEKYTLNSYANMNEYYEKKYCSINLAIREIDYESELYVGYLPNKDIINGEFSFSYYGNSSDAHFHFIILEHIIYVRHRNITID